MHLFLDCCYTLINIIKLNMFTSRQKCLVKKISDVDNVDIFLSHELQSLKKWKIRGLFLSEVTFHCSVLPRKPGKEWISS